MALQVASLMGLETFPPSPKGRGPFKTKKEAMRYGEWGLTQDLSQKGGR